MHCYIWEKFRIRSILCRIRNKFRINLFRITVNFFLTDTCIGIIKSSGVSKNCPNSKFPDKSSVGLKRFDCNKDYLIRVRHYKPISFGFEAQAMVCFFSIISFFLRICLNRNGSTNNKKKIRIEQIFQFQNHFNEVNFSLFKYLILCLKTIFA